jgi:hypothetical protein
VVLNLPLANFISDAQRRGLLEMEPEELRKAVDGILEEDFNPKRVINE